MLSQQAKQEEQDRRHGQTRAALRALMQDIEALLEECQGLPSAVVQKVCRRDLQRAKEVLAP